MKQFFSALIVGCGLIAAQAHAACEYPIAPGAFPDGTKATKEELLAAKKLYWKYDGEITAYLDCEKAEYNASLAAQPDATSRQKKDMERSLDKKQKAALKEAEGVKDRFNKELKAYGILHPPEPKTP